MQKTTLKDDASGEFNISIIIPALNEGKNIIATIDNILNAFNKFNLDGEIIVINDGSTDKTEELVNDFISRDNRVRIVNHKTPQGIGAAFWQGFDNSKNDSICLIPGDNENDPCEILRYFKLLEHVDIVIPFVFNKEVRSVFRNALSWVYRFIINATFKMNLNYTNGTVLYRKSILKDIEYRSSRFFFQTDILIRLVKRGYLFAEVPYKLSERLGGSSKAVSFPSFLNVAKGYVRLIRDRYFLKQKNPIKKDTLTAKRQNLSDFEK